MYEYEIMIMINICLLDSQKLGERIEEKIWMKTFPRRITWLCAL
jgi:hypothetical protein